nr:hypothetical protein [Tanacetum cinerariifolium]
MSRDVITVGSTMRILLLYRGEYSQWRERFMNYLEEKTDGLPNDIYSLIDSNETAKDLWDALERQMRGSEYAEQDRKAAILYEYETFKATEGEQLLDTYLRYLQYGTLLRQTKNLMDININTLYNILKQNQEKVKVQTKPEGSDDDDISDLKKITALLGKAFNRKKYYAKPTNNNLRTSSASSSANMKPDKKEGYFAKDCKKAKSKDYNYYKTKMLLAKKDIFMAQIEKVLSDSDESSSSAEETIVEVAYYTSESESESEFETSKYYNSTNYGLFVNNDDDQENFHDATESASKIFIENHIDSQKDYDKFEVDHNDFEGKEH